VTLGWSERDGGIEFAVHNPTVMPEEVQLQLFQRSFTTKGVGRGIGTYSMKLLGETYLAGRVAFDSHPETGTTFTLWLPKQAA
jgi:sensor histidine kinase regulating citrate/malate metabolism